MRKSTQAWIAGGAVLLVGLLLYVKGGELAYHDVKVTFPQPGTTLVNVDGKPDKATRLLAASDLWANTGLILEPKQSVLITASGRVNLAIHRLVKAANDDTRPTHGWYSPDGTTSSDQIVRTSYRADLRIEPKASDGVLLAALVAAGKPVPGALMPRPDQLFVVGSHLTLINESLEPRTIWLVVNDAVLNDSDLAKQAYLSVSSLADPKIRARPRGYNRKEQDDPESWTPLEHWEHVVAKQYWGLWYDDNIGFYHVQFDFKANSK